GKDLIDIMMIIIFTGFILGDIFNEILFNQNI
ncbi:unnamed protein product, partial [marine sediment metagenome]